MMTTFAELRSDTSPAAFSSSSLCAAISRATSAESAPSSSSCAGSWRLFSTRCPAWIDQLRETDDVADHCLAASVHMHVFDRHFLLGPCRDAGLTPPGGWQRFAIAC